MYCGYISGVLRRRSLNAIALFERKVALRSFHHRPIRQYTCVTEAAEKICIVRRCLVPRITYRTHGICSIACDRHFRGGVPFRIT